MADIVMDASSHQAIRAGGTEDVHYRAPPERTGGWRNKRLAGLEAMLAAAGHRFAIAPPTPETLASAGALIVASRSQDLPFAASDLQAIGDFVGRGGGLLLMANHRHFIRPQQDLAAALGLPLGFDDVSIVDYPEIAMDAHPVAAGCSRLHVRNTTSLSAAAGAQPVARFAADPRRLFAVAAACGSGRVLATGDSGFIASLDDAGQAMFEAASNARFFANAIDWLLGRG